VEKRIRISLWDIAWGYHSNESNWAIRIKNKQNKKLVRDIVYIYTYMHIYGYTIKWININIPFAQITRKTEKGYDTVRISEVKNSRYINYNRILEVKYNTKVNRLIFCNEGKNWQKKKYKYTKYIKYDLTNNKKVNIIVFTILHFYIGKK
jgi:hypothetical protein